MQNFGIVRRSSNQLHQKNHTPSYWGGTSNSSKIEVLEDASKWQDLKYIKLEWRSTQNSISFKKQKRYTPEQKVLMEIGKNMVHQSGVVKQSQKIWIILEARRKPKAWSSQSQSVRVVSRTKSQATEKSYSFILGRHNITFMKNQSTVQHITFTKLGINQSRNIENPKQQQVPKTKTSNCWPKLIVK